MHYSYLGTLDTWSPLLLGTPPPSTQSPLSFGIGYDLVVHRYTYRDWVYKVPITYIGNGAGLLCELYHSSSML